MDSFNSVTATFAANGSEPETSRFQLEQSPCLKIWKRKSDGSEAHYISKARVQSLGSKRIQIRISEGSFNSKQNREFFKVEYDIHYVAQEKDPLVLQLLGPTVDLAKRMEDLINKGEVVPIGTKKIGISKKRKN